MRERVPLRDSFSHSPIFCRLQHTAFLFLEEIHHKAVTVCTSLCHQPGTCCPCGLVVLAAATTDQEKKGLGMGLGWHCRAGASTHFTICSLLSAPSGEKAEARTLYIICFNQPVGLNRTISSHNNKILQHRQQHKQTPKKPQEKSLLLESKQLPELLPNN